MTKEIITVSGKKYQLIEEEKKELPKTWEELENIDGWYIDDNSEIRFVEKEQIVKGNKNIFKTKEQAQASIALSQLSQLRDVYRNSWVPDWENTKQYKYIIYFSENKIDTYYSSPDNYFLSFQTEEIRDKFLENFRDLIEEAKPLLG